MRSQSYTSPRQVRSSIRLATMGVQAQRSDSSKPWEPCSAEKIQCLPIGAGPGLGQVKGGGEGVNGDVRQHLTAGNGGTGLIGRRTAERTAPLRLGCEREAAENGKGCFAKEYKRYRQSVSRQYPPHGLNYIHFIPKRRGLQGKESKIHKNITSSPLCSAEKYCKNDVLNCPQWK